MRIATYNMTTTKGMHKPHFYLRLIIIAINILPLKLDEVFLYLVFVIPNIDKSIIILMTLFFMEH